MTSRRKQSTGSKIYSGVSTFGMIMADFKAIIGTIIGIIMIIAGIVFIRRQGVYTQQGTGIVKSTRCDIPTPITDDQGRLIQPTQYRWNCTITVYNADDTGANPTTKTMQKTLTGNNPTLPPTQDGTTIPIYINPKDPKDFSLSSDDTHVLGWILVIIGPILIIGTIAWAYFATKYKIIGAYEGVRTGVDMIRGD